MKPAVRGYGGIGEIASTLAEIARTLESAENCEGRVRRVLELLGRLIPYECCAVITDTSFFILPDTAAPRRAALQSSLQEMLVQMTEAAAQVPATTTNAGRIVLPIIGADRIIGLLHVEHGEGDVYDLHHVQLVSAVASQLGAYLAMGRLQEELRDTLAKVSRSDQELREFLETAAEGIHWVGPDGVILWTNQAELDLLGYSREDYLGHHIAEFHADRDVIEDILTRLGRNETLRQYEARLRCKDGTIKDVLISSNVRWEDGKFVHTRCFTHDITDRKRAENALRESERRLVDSEKRLRFMAESMPQKIFTATPTGEVDYFNPQWTEFTGLSFEQIRDWGWTQFIHPDDVAENVRVWQHSIDTGEPFLLEHRFRRADGEYCWHISRALVLRDAEGTVLMWVGSNTDIDGTKRLQERLQEANRVKDEFLATLSHELRTPLNAVLGWSHMLREGTLAPETKRRALESVVRNAKAQAQLVEDLLDVSRVVSGKLQINSDDVDLATVVAGAADTTRPAAIAKGVNLHVAIHPEIRIRVTGDADRLQQIVWNLLSNAVKFTAAGGRVDAELRPTDSHAEIVVKDTGEGIVPSVLPHVFERFRQADSTTSRRHGGLGLGLALVRYLTEAHGGTVSAESPGEGQGATFMVRLPIVAVSRRGDADQPTVPSPETDAVRGVRVLVVDDDPDARELIRVVLETRGGTVTSVNSAGEALHAIKEACYDVMLADIGMPEQDGYSLIQAIRTLSRDEGGEIPAVAVTAYASLRERERALDAGYNWHLAKPVDPDQLVAIVGTAVQAKINQPVSEPIGDDDGAQAPPRGHNVPESSKR